MLVLVQLDHLHVLVLLSMRRLLMLPLVTSFVIGWSTNQFYYQDDYENPEPRGASLFYTSSFLNQPFSNFFNPPLQNHRTSYSQSSKIVNNIQKNYDSSQSSQVVYKHFYFHAAPEGQKVQRITKEIVLGQPATNYKVIFIKAPVAPKKIIDIKAVYPKNEDKTVIYVLNKTPEDIEIKSVLTQPDRSKLTQPEVFFVRYNTNEEAIRAQNEIKAHYDQYGGSSQDHGEDLSSAVLNNIDKAKSNMHSFESDQLRNRELVSQSIRYTNAISSPGNV